jgi:hypothetical protein
MAGRRTAQKRAGKNFIRLRRTAQKRAGKNLRAPKNREKFEKTPSLLDKNP